MLTQTWQTSENTLKVMTQCKYHVKHIKAWYIHVYQLSTLYILLVLGYKLLLNLNKPLPCRGFNIKAVPNILLFGCNGAPYIFRSTSYHLFRSVCTCMLPQSYTIFCHVSQFKFSFWAQIMQILTSKIEIGQSFPLRSDTWSCKA